MAIEHGRPMVAAFEGDDAAAAEAQSALDILLQKHDSIKQAATASLPACERERRAIEKESKLAARIPKAKEAVLEAEKALESAKAEVEKLEL